MMTIDEVITKIGEWKTDWAAAHGCTWPEDTASLHESTREEITEMALFSPDLLAILQKARSDAEIVERLPKTADGKAIVPGMPVYPELLHDEDGFPDDGGTVELITIDGEIEIRDSQGEKGPNYVNAHASNVYSTREAALAAKGA